MVRELSEELKEKIESKRLQIIFVEEELNEVVEHANKCSDLLMQLRNELWNLRFSPEEASDEDN
jgi:hypothetical protein